MQSKQFAITGRRALGVHGNKLPRHETVRFDEEGFIKPMMGIKNRANMPGVFFGGTNTGDPYEET